MHEYPKLAIRGAGFTLSSLNEARDRALKELETCAATHLVIALQVITLQKAVTAVGIFSMFEAELQRALNSQDSFKEAKTLLQANGETALAEEFDLYILAINVLKHGRGRSYEKLVAIEKLPFRIKRPDEKYFNEGNIAEVTTEIEVDDAFVMRCAELVESVYSLIGQYSTTA